MLYQPEAFRELDLGTMHALMDAHGFATLISPDAQDPSITHLPLLLDRARGEFGTLVGHMARANPHWQRLETQTAVLALFHGPHTYVSPSWYLSHPSVPTWNYAVVHAHGEARLIQDALALEPIVRALVEKYESGREHPWRVEFPRHYMDKMLAAIVGFEIRITRLTGKFKLSQNRPAADVPRVIEALSEGSAMDREVAALMRSRSGL
jgi:transcriptional regulator